MAVGPLELIVVTFPREHLVDGVRSTLDRLASIRSMNVVDVLVIRTDASASPCSVELSELPGLGALGGLATGLLPQTDIDEVSAELPAGTDALAVLLEHRWMRDLAGPVDARGGTIVALHHIATVLVVHAKAIARVP
ncbi:DUF6325 family protein [Actinoplanes sp. NPDC051411]|uniref:DUF6325 family protein n=1 Tax=Actinoplanes sp. NPDC051411 TaxID=3155522 RepID=UPI00344810B3